MYCLKRSMAFLSNASMSNKWNHPLWSHPAFILNDKFFHSSISDNSILTESIKATLSTNGITSLTDIQLNTLKQFPLRPHHRFIIQSETGTGKTLAFLLFLLNKLTQANLKTPVFPNALIIVPNSDLAFQILQVAQSYGAPLGISFSLLGSVDFQKTLALASILHERKKSYIKQNGSEDGYEEEILQPERFPQSNVLITTLGKLNAQDFKKVHFLLPRISHFVLDEMDNLFAGADKNIVWKFMALLKDCITNRTVQTFIGSCATLPTNCTKYNYLSTLHVVKSRLHPSNDTNRLVKEANDLEFPVKIQHEFIEAIAPNTPSTEVKDPTEEEKFYFNSKIPIEEKLAYKSKKANESKDTALKFKTSLFLRYFEQNIATKPSIRLLVFFNSVTSIEKLTEVFNDLGLIAFISTIHSGTTDAIRREILNRFCTKKESDSSVDILFCTGIVTRGIDFKDIDIVVNFDFPTNAYEYAHRAGRTGRMGKEGKGNFYLFNFSRFFCFQR